MSTVTIEKTPDYLIVKIPLKAVEAGEAAISKRSQKAIDEAIAEGLAAVGAGKVFGPFQNIKEFRTAVKKLSVK